MRITVEVRSAIGPIPIRIACHHHHHALSEATACYGNANQQCPMGGAEAGADEISITA